RRQIPGVLRVKRVIVSPLEASVPLEGANDALLKRPDPEEDARMMISVPAVRLTFGGVALSALVFAVACGSDSSSTTAPSGTTTPTGPTFSVQVQQQILTPACVPCHTDEGRTPSGGLNLKSGTAYASLINVASTGKSGAVRVIPGNPNGSYLIQKLEGAADIVGLRMPRNGPPYLTDAQVQPIRRRVQTGAPNNGARSACKAGAGWCPPTAGAVSRCR